MAYGTKKKHKKSYQQVGKTHLLQDRRYHAKRVGWRKSEKGKWYFENRANRSDAHSEKI